MAWFADRDYLAKEALRRIDEHVKECKENNQAIYKKIEEGYASIDKRFGEAHNQNKKRLDAIVWSALLGSVSVILFLLDKIATSKGIWQ